jgi:hypothetical protein
MPDQPHWLRAEETGQEELAERAFARLIAELPSVEPSSGFVDRAMHAAWQARRHRRQARRLAWTAATVSITALGAGLIYELAGPATTLAARVTVSLSHVLVWLLTSTTAEAGWWSIAERVGTAVGNAIVSPSAAVSIAGFEMIALLALYALRRLLGQELRRPSNAGQEAA